MGRGKLPMEYMKKDRARNTTFEKRKNGLKKKAHELATLCDVPLCMIIYQGPNSVPDTVPANREDALKIISRYTSIPKEESAKRSVNLQAVLDSKKRKTDHQQLSKLQNNDDGTWLPVLDGCTKEELSVLATILHNKMQAVEKRIGILRASFGNYGTNGGGGFGPWGGGSYYDPNVLMGRPNFYHPHGQGGGGVGGSGMHQPMAAYGGGARFEPHQMQMQMQMGGHKSYGNC